MGFARSPASAKIPAAVFQIGRQASEAGERLERGRQRWRERATKTQGELNTNLETRQCSPALAVGVEVRKLEHSYIFTISIVLARRRDSLQKRVQGLAAGRADLQTEASARAGFLALLLVRTALEHFSQERRRAL